MWDNCGIEVALQEIPNLKIENISNVYSNISLSTAWKTTLISFKLKRFWQVIVLNAIDLADTPTNCYFKNSTSHASKGNTFQHNYLVE